MPPSFLQSFNYFLLWLMILSGTLLAGYISILPTIPLEFRRKQNSPVVARVKVKTIKAHQKSSEKISLIVRRPEAVVSSNRRLHMSKAEAAIIQELEFAKSLAEAKRMIYDGNWAGAESKLLALIAASPNNAGALKELALVNLIEKKDPVAAVPFIKRFLKLNPNNDYMISELISAYKKIKIGPIRP